MKLPKPLYVRLAVAAALWQAAAPRRRTRSTIKAAHASCRGVVYCCREHQVSDWPAHKAACKAARKAAAPDNGGAGPGAEADAMLAKLANEA